MRNSLERFLEQSSSKPSRRAVLRGAGVAMTLPWLESVSALGATTGTSPYPQRFAAVFMGNGINGNHWWSKGSGDAMQLSKSLEPLAPIKKKINVINGLFNEPAVGEGPVCGEIAHERDRVGAMVGRRAQHALDSGDVAARFGEAEDPAQLVRGHRLLA